MLRYIVFFSTLIILSSHSFADEAEAEFKQLYADFNELYANSEDIDPIIKAGEKLYKLAPKTYGKNSQNMAAVTYNLASLYDEKGGETDSDEEKKALKLYKKYFDILDKLKTIKDNTYLQQYQQYMFTYHNIKKGKANEKISGKLLNTAYGLNITNLELANIEFTVAIIRFKHKKIKNSETLFNNALEKFTQEYGSENESVLHLQYWLAMVDLKNKKFDEAIPRLEKVAKFYFDNKLEQNAVLENSHQTLHYIYFTKRKNELSLIHSSKYHNLGKEPLDLNIYDSNDSTFLPIFRVPPMYPYYASERGIEGYTTVVFTVTPEGKTKDVRALESSHKSFEPTSIKAAEKYRYKPKTINGIAVEVKNVRVRLEFRLGY